MTDSINDLVKGDLDAFRLAIEDNSDSVTEAYRQALALALYLRKVIAEGNTVGRHGADDTPYEGEEATAGRLLARILNGGEAERLGICGRLLAGNKRGNACWEREHENLIENLERKVRELSRAFVALLDGTQPDPDSDIVLDARWTASRLPLGE